MTPHANTFALRVLVFITFHYDPTRLVYLQSVLHALAEFEVAQLRIVLVTNALRPEEEQILRRLMGVHFDPAAAVIESCPGLIDPWDLPWQHKSMLRVQFAESGDGFTHVIYLEGDIRLSFRNFRYWLAAREVLTPYGLLPAFLRYEFNPDLHLLTLSDFFNPVWVPHQSHVTLGDLVFVNVPNPYNPLYILDRVLIDEYIASPSFTLTGSATVCNWGNPERAAIRGWTISNPRPISGTLRDPRAPT